jgi:hypothetical protein
MKVPPLHMDIGVKNNTMSKKHIIDVSKGTSQTRVRHISNNASVMTTNHRRVNMHL